MEIATFIKFKNFNTSQDGCVWVDIEEFNQARRDILGGTPHELQVDQMAQESKPKFNSVTGSEPDLRRLTRIVDPQIQRVIANVFLNCYNRQLTVKKVMAEHGWIITESQVSSATRKVYGKEKYDNAMVISRRKKGQVDSTTKDQRRNIAMHYRGCGNDVQGTIVWANHSLRLIISEDQVIKSAKEFGVGS